MSGTPAAGVRRISTKPNTRIGGPEHSRRAGWLVVLFCVILAIVLALFWLLGEDPGTGELESFLPEAATGAIRC